MSRRLLATISAVIAFAAPCNAQQRIPYVPKIDLASTRGVVPASSSSRHRAIAVPSFGVFDLQHPPVAADLAETEDAPRTPRIAATAQALGGVIGIFNFVSTTIAFEPYYGSRKGAHLTLLQRSGSAEDIANVLVALLRAAGYPSRYVMGRVTASTSQMTDWLGVESADAAVTVLKSGGIPADTEPLGRISFEHTWVAVYTGGHWIELDASFKKFVQHKPSLAVPTREPFAQFMTRVRATGAVDVANQRVLMTPRVPSPLHPDDDDYDVDLIEQRFNDSVADATKIVDDNTDAGQLFGTMQMFAPVISILGDAAGRFRTNRS